MSELAKEVIFEWYKQRIEAIHQSVTCFDVLRRHGVSLNQGSDNREEQLSCPFHGKDNKPSARVYPASGAKERSNVWCWVCRENWDAISLWRKFNGADQWTFGQVLTGVENAFNLTPPPAPTQLYAESDRKRVNPELEEFTTIVRVCEARLLKAKPAYKKLGDLHGYLLAGSVIDKVEYQVRHKVLSPQKGTELLWQLMERLDAKAQVSFDYDIDIPTCPVE